MRTDPTTHAEGAVLGLRMIEALTPAEYERRGAVVATVAQVHATLALVEEQRTANLLALVALDDAARAGRGVRVLSPDLRDSLVAQVGARLGIEGVR